MGFLLGVSLPFIFILLLMLFGDYYCDYWGDKYSSDSWCFDPNYRCSVECGVWNRNFTGIIDNTLCDCGDAWVSICSGFLYPKNENKRVMNNGRG